MQGSGREKAEKVLGLKSHLVINHHLKQLQAPIRGKCYFSKDSRMEGSEQGFATLASSG